MTSVFQHPFLPFPEASFVKIQLRCSRVWNWIHWRTIKQWYLTYWKETVMVTWASSEFPKASMESHCRYFVTYATYVKGLKQSAYRRAQWMKTLKLAGLQACSNFSPPKVPGLALTTRQAWDATWEHLRGEGRNYMGGKYLVFQIRGNVLLYEVFLPKSGSIKARATWSFLLVAFRKWQDALLSRHKGNLLSELKTSWDSTELWESESWS